MKDIEFKLTSSLSKVFTFSENVEEETAGSVLLGEWAHFQAAARSGSEINVRVEVNGGLPAEVCLIEELPATREYGDNTDDYVLFSETGKYPELLTDETDAGLKVNEWRAWWISVKIETTCSAGNYPLNVRLLCGTEILAEKTYTIKVIGAKLEPHDLIMTYWIHYDCICEQHHVEMFSESFYSILAIYMQEYIACGNNMVLTPLFTPPLDTAVGGERMTCQLVHVTKVNGRYSFDFSLLDTFVDFMRRVGIEYFEFSHLCTQWGAAYCPKVMAVTENGEKKIFGWDTRSDEKEYKDFLQAFLPKLVDYTRKKGIYGKCFYHISDEPSSEHLAKYKKIYQTVKKLIGGQLVIDALSDYKFCGVVDLPVVATNCIEPFLKNGKNYIAYYCSCQCNQYVSNRFFAMPSERNRVLGMQLYLNKAKGFLHWGYNFYHTQYSIKSVNPYEETSAGGAFASGDSFVIYPAGKSVKKSLRLDVFAEGIQDYRALLTLEKLIGRKETETLLKEQGFSGYGIYPHTTGFLKKIREKINVLIDKEIEKQKNYVN